MRKSTWIAVDWGTSHLRAWLMDGSTEKAERHSSSGMGRLTPDQFEPTFLDLAGDWLETATTPIVVVACGMVGARQGWIEAPYASAPCAPPIDGSVLAPFRNPSVLFHVLPGVMQTSPADVMRGEETQIAGFLSLNPDFDGILLLPGSHSKWVQISAGEIVSFRTFMTGELFAAIGQHTVLRHSLSDDGWAENDFADAVADGMSRPEQLAARLFGLRAESLLADLSPAAARSRLSGYLLGAELAAARPYWLGTEIAVIGAGPVCRPYMSALRAQGLSPIEADGSAMTRAGLTAAWKKITE